MRRAISNSLLSLLLLVTLIWGGCVSCEQYFMFGGAKSCCSPNGHCKTKNSPSQNSERACKQIAFDHHKAVDFHIDLTAMGSVKIEPPLLRVEAREHWRRGDPAEPSPPDLQILHSTFLI